MQQEEFFAITAQGILEANSPARPSSQGILEVKETWESPELFLGGKNKVHCFVVLSIRIHESCT